MAQGRVPSLIIFFLISQTTIVIYNFVNFYLFVLNYFSVRAMFLYYLLYFLHWVLEKIGKKLYQSEQSRSTFGLNIK